MGYGILTDTETDRSVLYCTTAERPLDCEGFIGPDCREQAEDFLEWLDCDPRDKATLLTKGYKDGPDERGTWWPAIDHAKSAWHDAAFSAQGYFVGRS